MITISSTHPMEAADRRRPPPWSIRLGGKDEKTSHDAMTIASAKVLRLPSTYASTGLGGFSSNFM